MKRGYCLKYRLPVSISLRLCVWCVHNLHFEGWYSLNGSTYNVIVYGCCKELSRC